MNKVSQFCYLRYDETMCIYILLYVVFDVMLVMWDIKTLVLYANICNRPLKWLIEVPCFFCTFVICYKVIDVRKVLSREGKGLFFALDKKPRSRTHLCWRRMQLLEAWIVTLHHMRKACRMRHVMMLKNAWCHALHTVVSWPVQCMLD